MAADSWPTRARIKSSIRPVAVELAVIVSV